MDKKVLLEWKTSNTKVYTRFKQDLERQLSKPYHQTILDLVTAMPNHCVLPLRALLPLHPKTALILTNYTQKQSKTVMSPHIVCAAIFFLTMVQTN